MSYHGTLRSWKDGCRCPDCERFAKRVLWPTPTPARKRCSAFAAQDDGRFKCSTCGGIVENIWGEVDGESVAFAYCPICGTKIGGEE